MRVNVSETRKWERGRKRVRELVVNGEETLYRLLAAKCRQVVEEKGGE